jgi:hypothetical protein
MQGGNIDADALGDVAGAQALDALFDNERPGCGGDFGAAIIGVGTARRVDIRAHGAGHLQQFRASINHLIEAACASRFPCEATRVTRAGASYYWSGHANF